MLGYREKGLECEHQHVRECPDFAEKGACPNPRCKLPHVIRANQRRANTATATSARTMATDAGAAASVTQEGAENGELFFLDDGRIGDEYISLTFHGVESWVNRAC